MQTKLTLRLDAGLVEQAKHVARENGKSVSQMVADYFIALSAVDRPVAPPSGTQSLRGIMRGYDVSEQDYRAYLEEKHL